MSKIHDDIWAIGFEAARQRMDEKGFDVPLNPDVLPEKFRRDYVAGWRYALAMSGKKSFNLRFAQSRSMWAVLKMFNFYIVGHKLEAIVNMNIYEHQYLSRDKRVKEIKECRLSTTDLIEVNLSNAGLGEE